MGTRIEKAEYHGGAFEINGGDDVWDVTVTKRKDPKA